MRAGIALARANLRYWSAIAPLVREQLAYWRSRAHAIDDPTLSALADEKLRDEAFNAEVAATLATLAPRQHRRRVVNAIVALEILYDYLDGLTEPPACSRADGERLFTALTDAVSSARRCDGDYYSQHPRVDRSGYIDELVSTVRFALAELPGTTKLSDVLHRVASRCGEAQLRIHTASPQSLELEHWARAHSSGTSLEWREFLAGAASSVLSVHALIAAAANPSTTHAEALEIDHAYLSIAALPTVLDSVIDYEHDLAAGRAGYVRLFDDSELLQRRLVGLLREALERARSVPEGPHHVMTIVGIVAYYTSAPSAAGEFALAATGPSIRHLQPLIAPTLAVMYAWRFAKRAHTVKRRFPALRLLSS